VLRCLSNSSIRRAPPNTGTANISKKEAKAIPHTNIGILNHHIFFNLMVCIVVSKFIELTMEDAPAKCKLIMQKSREALIEYVKGG
jgi:hypothetical protein